MKYQTTSSDGLTFDNPDSASMYVNPLASVMANYVYNSLLVGRPYFLQMIEDTEIVMRSINEHLGIKDITLTGPEETQLLLQQIATTLKGVKYSPDGGKAGLTWPEIIKEKREKWPVQYLMPGGAFIR